MKRENTKIRKRKINSAAKPAVIALIILLVLGTIAGYIWKVLTTSDYFQIKSIVSRETLSPDLSYLMKKNIFMVDLPRESLNILKNCPDCYRIRLARILPDRLYVEYVKRKPLAFIRLNNYIAVDAQGVVFNSSIKPEESGLPIILGLESRLSAPRSGKLYEVKELFVALDILSNAARNPLLRDYKISRIDVGDVDDIMIQIPLIARPLASANAKVQGKSDFLEVKISQGNIRDKVVIMAGLINQEKHNLASIKYIDLRFKEPVIKFKDVK